MASSTLIAPADKSRAPIAPWWHTLLVLLPLAVGSIASWYQGGLPNVHIPGISSRLSSYITVLVQEWGVILLIWLALKRRGFSIGGLISGRWQTAVAFLRDVGLAVGFLVVAVPLIAVLVHVIGGDANTNVANIIPKTKSELVVWLPLAATGGFCEELIFRGYLTRQFHAWTGSSVLAIVFQGVLFGLAHGYYEKVMVLIMIQGWLLGMLAYWRKSLRPGMLAHGLQDAIGGVVGFFS